VQRKDQYVNTVIDSPMDGVVRNVRITTRGGVARAGEEIMQIVPSDDNLLLEVKVQTADIAFVKPGLPATIKMDAYDYTVYGTLSGVVTYISADTVNDEVRTANEKPFFKVLVKATGKNYLGKAAEIIKIQPGMTGTAEIKTGNKSVWKYLTKPLSKTLSESLGER
jgi:membrane fusion protein, adhesin transport system